MNPKEEFLIDYRLYIELLRNLDEAGIPKTLDTADLWYQRHTMCINNQP